MCITDLSCCCGSYYHRHDHHHHHHHHHHHRHYHYQVEANIALYETSIPPDLWRSLKEANLLPSDLELSPPAPTTASL